MKKRSLKICVALLLVVVLFAGIASVSMAGEKKWSCSRYYKGEYQGYMTVWASSYEEAIQKACEFYKNYTYDSIKCE